MLDYFIKKQQGFFQSEKGQGTFQYNSVKEMVEKDGMCLCDIYPAVLLCLCDPQS